MVKKDLNIAEDKINEKTKEMCNSCIHKSYCPAAYKKDHWCGNHKV